MDHEKKSTWEEERPMRMRKDLVEKILEKSTFAGVTGRTIAEYSKDLEHYIVTGELFFS